jgi:hypothetical protein
MGTLTTENLCDKTGANTMKKITKHIDFSTNSLKVKFPIIYNI